MKTDKQLQQDVMAELDWEPSVDAALIGVQSSVTPGGTVHNWSDRERAASTAWCTPGVHNVVANISVHY